MRFALLALAVLAIPTPSVAATIVQTRGLIGGSPFASFDSALGTLNSATADATVFLSRSWYYRDDPTETTGEVSYVIDGRYDFWRNSAAFASIPIAGAGTLQFGLNQGILFSVAGFDTTASGSGSFNLDLASVTDVRGFFISGVDPYWGTAGGTPDTIITSPYTTDIFRLQGGCGGTGSDGCQGGFVKLTYGYTPSVPEPATWAMMLIGFGVLGASLRSRRSVRLAR